MSRQTQLFHHSSPGPVQANREGRPRTADCRCSLPHVQPFPGDQRQGLVLGGREVAQGLFDCQPGGDGIAGVEGGRPAKGPGERLPPLVGSPSVRQNLAGYVVQPGEGFGWYRSELTPREQEGLADDLVRLIRRGPSGGVGVDAARVLVEDGVEAPDRFAVQLCPRVRPRGYVARPPNLSCRRVLPAPVLAVTTLPAGPDKKR